MPPMQLSLLLFLLLSSQAVQSRTTLHPQPPLLLENGLASTPPMGWNSWNHYKCNVTEDIIRQTADAIISTGLAARGYRFVNIDDCWAQLHRSSDGYLLANTISFPSGIKALADYVHARGLFLGIYSDAGTHTCQGQPGSLYHEEKDAATFASWGVDYLKYDNCHNKMLPPEPRYRRMSQALLRTGRPIFFSICEWGRDDPATWAPAISNSWRTTQDIKDKWSSMRNIAYKNNAWAGYAHPGAWNDPDMLEVGNGGMSKDEYVTHFSLWALMKAPLLVGCNMVNINTDTLQILSNKEVVEVNQDPLGVQGKKVSQSGLSKKLEVWAGPLSGNRTVVLLWNQRSKASVVKVEWADVGFDNNMSVQIRDLWEHHDLPSLYKGSFEVLVKARAVKMYIFTKTATNKQLPSEFLPNHQ